MCVWMKPGSRYAPRASIVVSHGPAGSAPTETMRPPRMPTAPSTMSRPSFIVRMVALRTIVEGTDVEALHREPRGGGAAADGDELGENADGDLGRRDGADFEADRRVHAIQALERHAFGDQRVPDARHLGPAPDQTEVAEVARGERAQGVQIVLMTARKHDDERAGRNRSSVQPLRNRLDDDIRPREA